MYAPVRRVTAPKDAVLRRVERYLCRVGAGSGKMGDRLPAENHPSLFRSRSHGRRVHGRLLVEMWLELERLQLEVHADTGMDEKELLVVRLHALCTLERLGTLIDWERRVPEGENDRSGVLKEGGIPLERAGRPCRTEVGPRVV